MNRNMSEWFSSIVVPAVTAFVGALVSWIFSRRKYNAEVEAEKASVTQQIQDTYQELIGDLKHQIDALNQQVEASNIKASKAERDMLIMKAAMYELLDSTCQIDCSKRKPLTTQKVIDIMKQLKEE